MRFRDVCLAVLVALIWGFNFVVIDAGLADFPPLLFSALRFTVAAVPAVLFVRRGDIPWRTILAVGVVLGVVKYSLLFVGIKAGMPAGLASLVVQAQALFTMLFAALALRDLPTRWQKVGVGLGFAGIAMIAVTALSPTSVGGFALVLGAAVAWGAANILIKRANVDTFRLMVWMSTVPPVPLLLASLATEHGQLDALPQLLTWRGAGSVVYTGLVATVLAFGIWGYLFRRYSTHLVAPFALLVPVFGMGSSAVLLGERIRPLGLVAAGLVLAGLVTIVLGRRTARYDGIRPVVTREELPR
ncbi:EamA family transporter [Longispora sp. K20-0274]|uniref:EamA family transporter n=1 Tax=Longispora sp. K20-0274 TaxID=3088255 RepID=UPI003999F1E7